MNSQIPLLFFGDSPSSPTGLARIGRDLAYIASNMEEFRVGYLGRGVPASRKIPYMQYTFPELDQWGESWIQDVWYDFAGDVTGIVMTVWDPSRLLWFANPVALPNEAWLRHPPFQRWGYFAIDSEGVSGRLTCTAAETLKHYDRVLTYGMFGSAVASNTLQREVEWIPHGINMDTFQPRDGQGIRIGMGISPNTTLVGCVMTNQDRKNWALAFESAAILRQKHPELKLKFWFKVDLIDRHWDLQALTCDFGVEDIVTVDDKPCTDIALSYMYSACDVTFLPSLGEGFGYPIVESLACGTPCIHGNYAGGAELIPRPDWLVPPVAWRYNTRHNCRRPVFVPEQWADTLHKVVIEGKQSEFCRNSVEHLNWSNLHTVWQKWFREGLK
jgi:glycosyltransferase involved in cell wall biosynthesis